jgi:chromosome segregation ATPase
MNNLLKEKLRGVKEEIKVFNLKKESLNDKVKMQENFIEELETRSKENIEEKNGKIKTLQVEVDTHMEHNELTDANIAELVKKQEEVTGATEKLRTLGDLKGKISQKVSTITKEHKFFTDNVTCPTCTQPIEEEFRINKIEDAQNRAKELQAGFKQLEDTLKNEEERERHFTQLSKEITTLTHGISKNNTKRSGIGDSKNYRPTCKQKY